MSGSTSDPNVPSTTETLGAVLDEHLRWVGQWQRAVFYRNGIGGERASAPASFIAWCQAAQRDDLLQQPAVQKLATLHEQMHRQARLVLLKAQGGDLPTEAEYQGVIGRFEEFMLHLRRMERAFAAAASGLDPLTGLRTRRGMAEALEREHNRFRRAGQPFCVALCDIDKFKGINDTYGHDIGDRVLAATAAVISRGVRSFDEAFRMGGEEFLVCLKETGIDEGYAVIERLRIDLMRSPVTLPDGRVIPVTASFGLVEAAADLTVDDLVVCADRALYQAKHSGRNRVIRYGLDRPEHKPVPAKAGRG
ncbi:diguanylate cyclase [Azospirillum picis]|uniref:diguanylate cyclase n=1 Tax=Azospirillum picis TaxID=488438 RepID=A0ABU0MPX8_9PROT|nr:diguanylate cyclase [Azospirillum picis]MBP2301652.1 diguanylate cyclase (GGDEF)-like protein [Azospirillum picis]MDQ0535525.1 diguanylate cyclase (GGDEF)-like protein [Azospirillum picis]